METSKVILLLDYITALALLLATAFNSEMTTVTVTWIGQLGISTGFYFWKAKNENKTKVPINVLKSLPRGMKKDLDLTEIIKSILQE